MLLDFTSMFIVTREFPLLLSAFLSNSSPDGSFLSSVSRALDDAAASIAVLWKIEFRSIFSRELAMPASVDSRSVEEFLDVSWKNFWMSLSSLSFHFFVSKMSSSFPGS